MNFWSKRCTFDNLFIGYIVQYLKVSGIKLIGAKLSFIENVSFCWTFLNIIKTYYYKASKAVHADLILMRFDVRFSFMQAKKKSISSADAGALYFFRCHKSSEATPSIDKHCSIVFTTLCCKIYSIIYIRVFKQRIFIVSGMQLNIEKDNKKIKIWKDRKKSLNLLSVINDWLGDFLSLIVLFSRQYSSLLAMVHWLR